MRKYKKAAGLLAVSLVISMCSGCVMDREKSSESQAGETANLTDEDAEIKKAAKQDINEVHLRDKDTLYENDDETSVVTMYLTVSRGNVSENTDHSWKEINNYSVYDYDAMGVERYQAAALLHRRRVDEILCRSGMKMVHSRERSVMERLRQMPQCRSVDRHPANMHRRITKSS